MGPLPAMHPLDMSERVCGAMRTDVGVVRTRNEDAAYVDPDGRFFLLADGMGGHDGGDVASTTAIDVCRMILAASAHELDAFEAAPDADGRQRIRTLLARAVRDANEIVMERGRVDPDLHEMGTTLEVVVVVAHEMFVAHVGDSRTYLVRNGRALRLTTDHTVAESMRRAGLMSEADASSSPMRSVLTNVIGYRSRPVVDQLNLRLEAGDRVLICSDGLHDAFTTAELSTVVREGEIDTVLDGLILIARARGGQDNITGIVIEAPPPRGSRPRTHLDG